MERCLYSRPNEGQLARLATKSRRSPVRLDKVLRNLWTGKHLIFAVMPDRRRSAYCLRISTSGIRIRNCGKIQRTHQLPTSTPTSWMWAKHPSLSSALENSIFERLHDDGVGGQGTRERNKTAMLISRHSGTERACDFARTVRNLFFAFP